MGAILDKHVESLKEEFDILGPKLNGLTYQRIINHMKRYGEEYATECIKASLDKVANVANIINKYGESFCYHDVYDTYTGTLIDTIEVDKQSITSTDNIVLL